MSTKKKMYLFISFILFLWIGVIIGIYVYNYQSIKITTLKKDFYQFEKLEESNFLVEKKQLNGTLKRIKNFFIFNPEINSNQEVITFKYKAIRKKIKISPIKVKSLQSNYNNNKIYEGELFNKKKWNGTILYEDNKKINLNNKQVQFLKIPFIFHSGNNSIIISSKYGIFKQTIKAIPIKYFTCVYQDYFINDTINIKPPVFKIVYKDNTEKIVSSTQITGFESIQGSILDKNKNEFSIKYLGKNYPFFIYADEKNSVTFAKHQNLKDIQDSTFKYISNNTFVTVVPKHTETGYYLLTHVIVNNPNQIHGGLSFDNFGGIRELPTEASKRLNWVLGINGSYFSYDTGEPVCANVFIKNGIIYKDGFTNGKEVCLKTDGTFFTPQIGISATELLNMGVTNIWGTADPLLLQNGERIDTTVTINDKFYPRTAIGMVKPCEYYIITAGTWNYNGGISFEEMQNIFLDLNCTYARSLDGGGSSSLVLKNKLINIPATWEERAVVDFLYFTE